MSTITAPAHWVRPNEVSRQPKCWVFLDTEANIAQTAGEQVQTWRLAVTCHEHRHKGWTDWGRPDWAVHETPSDLWDWVDARAKAGERMILVAHNLAYDLRVSDAFRELLARGWTLDRIRLDAEQAQCRWKQGRRTLLMIDSLSWFPGALSAIGDEVEIAKPPLPAWDGPEADWVARCTADVAILRAAWLQVIHWLHDEDLGCWQPTGASMAWSAWRHNHMTDRILVGEDPHIRDLERAAVWSGRSEAWQHGVIAGGPFTEWDVELAYLRIMRDCGVPVRMVGHRERPKRKDLDHWLDVACVLARVRVATETPVVPCAGPKGIVWPVGTFETVVWDPELRLLLGSDAKVDVLEVAVYTRRPALQSFAEWLWPLASGDDPETPPVIRRVAKHWSRAFVGRFGVRYTDWIPYGATPRPQVGLETVLDLDSGESFRLLSMGDRCMREAGLVEGENAVPSVMGWIMSETRRRLWVMMTDAGLENVLHCDTDGLVVNDEGSRRLEVAGKAGIRIKAVYKSAEVLGARQVIYGGQLRAPGIPRRAVRTGPDTWTGETWTRLTTSLSAGELDRVRVQARQIHLVGTDNRRRHVEAGQTEAFVMVDGVQIGGPHEQQ